MGYIRDRWKDPARKGKGLRWQVKYRKDGRELDGGSFDTKEVAKRKLIELESQVHRGQWVDPNNPTTVVELVRAHAATRMHRPRTAARIESMIRNHLEPTPLGGRRAVAVRPSEVQSWVSDRAQHMAPSTLRILVSLVSGTFNAAVLDRVVGASPFVRVTLPKVEKERIVPLTVQQVGALAGEIGERYRAMVLVQAGCGLRIGELLALRVQDVDFLRRTLRVEDQIDRVTRQRVPPKTARSR
ncbi:MAG: tyrosine-type recombinase/integrase, partial [Actinomycetes bacterium]